MAMTEAVNSALSSSSRSALAFVDVGNADPLAFEGFLPKRDLVVAAGHRQHVAGNGPSNRTRGFSTRH